MRTEQEIHTRLAGGAAREPRPSGAPGLRRRVAFAIGANAEQFAGARPLSAARLPPRTSPPRRALVIHPA